MTVADIKRLYEELTAQEKMQQEELARAEYKRAFGVEYRPATTLTLYGDELV